MKQTLKISMILTICVMLSIAGNKRDKESVDASFIIGQKTSAPASAAAASSPWLPLNYNNVNSQYRLVDYNNGALLFSGANVVAPLVGNYRGYVSKDSGKSWTKFSMPIRQSTATSTSMRYSRVTAANESTFVLGDYYGFIMRTTNGGVKWDTVGQKPYDAAGFYNDIKFVSSSVAIAMGDKVDSVVFFNRSTDGGLTWNRVSVPSDSVSQLFDYGNGGTGIIANFGNNVWVSTYDADAGGVNHPGIYKSTDLGATWTLQRPLNLETPKRYFFRNLSFSSATVGYAVSGGTGLTGRLHKTTDGGATWSDSINIEVGVDRLNQQVIGVNAIAGTNNVIAVGFSAATGSKSWMSTDAGATWTTMVTPGNTTTNLNSAYFFTSTKGFAVGQRAVLAYTPSVEVTFNVNTSSIPDTLKATSTVQMRGDGGASGGILDWNGASSVRFANIGGDYWQAKVRFAPGADFPYKLYTHAQANVGAGHPGEHNGWENDINTHGNGNRRMVVGQNDTTISIQFVNGSTAQQDQFWRPYTESDSLEVTFRVNMQNQEDFNPLTQGVGVNGSFQGWGTPSTFKLKREANHGNGGSVAYTGPNFWSGTFKLPLKKANTDTLSAPLSYAYKFVQFNNATPNDYKWESVSDRTFQIKKGSQDTTLYWKWWDDVGVKPPAGTDTAIVRFSVDMSKAISTNGYTVGDTVQVRYGFASSAALVGTKNLVKVGLSNVFAATDSSIKGVQIKADGTGKPLVYQYYIVKNGQDFRESYYNFGYTGSDVTLAERRLLPLTAKSNAGVDTSKDQTKANRWPFFRNTRKLTQNVDVKFTVNLAPAFWQVAKGDTLFGIQNTVNVTNKDSVYKWGVAINGPAAGGWNAWGQSLIDDAARRMVDDGTNGDAVAGDHIYTKVIKFYKDSLNNVVGQEFKFGIKGGDNEGGKGGFGNNHIENINDAAATATIHSQFGSINPLYYNQWNFATETKSVKQIDGATPTQFELTQNYPNPFNPSTVINYSIPVNGMVSLKVFNVLGQEVATLVNEMQTVGNYKATFNATSLSSGVYFYKIEAGNFTSVKKMMFLK